MQFGMLVLADGLLGCEPDLKLSADVGASASLGCQRKCAESVTSFRRERSTSWGVMD